MIKLFFAGNRFMVVLSLLILGVCCSKSVWAADSEIRRP
jgi:hypothetical protein